MDSTDAPQIIEHIHKVIIITIRIVEVPNQRPPNSSFAFGPSPSSFSPSPSTYFPQHTHLQSLNFTPYETKFVPCSARFVCLGISPKAKGILAIHEMAAGSLNTIGEYVLPHGIKCATFGASPIEGEEI